MVSDMCVAAANYIIESTNAFNATRPYAEQIAMTGKRLQKLLYFSDVEYMKRNEGQSMFKEEFYAWPSGPVIPSVYYEFMQYQDGQMVPMPGEHKPITSKMREAIDCVLERTKDMDPLDLVEYSHTRRGPWRRVYNADDPDHRQIIPKNEIYDFYKKQDMFAVSQD